MTEDIKAQESVESDKSELVSVTFHNGRQEEVTRDVYPEVAKFIISRREATQTLRREQRAAARARRQYIWEKEDEYYADPSHAELIFDDYHCGREWDRDNNNFYRHDERKYYDFINGSARNPASRNSSENPNSWDILYREAQAAGHGAPVWIIDNCMDSESEATIIMQYLPASVEELWEIAKADHDMCNVFDRYMEQAESAGLFKEEDVPVALRETRALQSYLRRNIGGSYVRNVTDRIKPIVKAEREAAVAAARARWDKELLDKYASSQDMNELLRSLADGHPAVQQHLNRSDAAKAAWERRRAELLTNMEAPEEATA